jgi:hypothetical protein
LEELHSRQSTALRESASAEAARRGLERGGVQPDAQIEDFMAQAIGKMPGPTRIMIRSVEASGGVRTAKAEFHYVPKKITVKTFRFDGNLLSSDLFSLVRA